MKVNWLRMRSANAELAYCRPMTAVLSDCCCILILPEIYRSKGCVLNDARSCSSYTVNRWTGCVREYMLSSIPSGSHSRHKNPPVPLTLFRIICSKLLLCILFSPHTLSIYLHYLPLKSIFHVCRRILRRNNRMCSRTAPSTPIVMLRAATPTATSRGFPFYVDNLSHGKISKRGHHLHCVLYLIILGCCCLSNWKTNGPAEVPEARRVGRPRVPHWFTLVPVGLRLVLG